MPRLLALLLCLGIASPASAVTMEWTFIGNPGNACDPQPEGCFGAVDYDYSIGTYEVTNAQYVDFLNAKAASDPLELYNTSMADVAVWKGGIERSGSPGSYTYSSIAGRENMPVGIVSFYDAMRFANWMNNGQGNGNTETGAYTLLGNDDNPSNGTTVTRNAGATIVLPNVDEWSKAAYYSPTSATYFDYPAGTDTQTSCSTPTATTNRANCFNTVGDLTNVGSYTGSASPYGTFDQGGNAWEWNDVIIGGQGRISGGSYVNSAFTLHAGQGLLQNRGNSSGGVGFRIAMIPGGYVPEPSTGLLVIAGLFGLAVRRRVSA